MKRILVDSGNHSTRIALVEDGELTEFIYENENNKSIVGNIYVGRVTSVHKGMQACFVDIGEEKNAYMLVPKGQNIQAYSHVIVQVIKDAAGSKGAGITNEISFAGKFLVLIPGGNGSIGISKKIISEEERERIKNIIKELMPKGYGVIIRTEGMDKTIEEFREDIEHLYEISESVLSRGKYEKAPCLLFSEEDIVLKSAKNLFGASIDEIVLNDRKKYEAIKNDTHDRPERVKFYEEEVQMFENYFVESQVEKLLNKKVWLKSGGFIIIEKTEACVVIDVNTGKYTGKRDFQETVFKTNVEAAKEIAKQLKLRNLSGMIIVDFIDMKDEERRIALRHVLEREIRKDRIRTTVVGMTELGLMQITRKKTSVSLGEKIMEECKSCRGIGAVESFEYISDRILREIISIFARTNFNQVTVSSNRRLLKVFAGTNNTNIHEMEKSMGKKILLKEIETAAQGYYEIEGKISNEH